MCGYYVRTCGFTPRHAGKAFTPTVQMTGIEPARPPWQGSMQPEHLIYVGREPTTPAPPPSNFPLKAMSLAQSHQTESNCHPSRTRTVCLPLSPWRRSQRGDSNSVLPLTRRPFFRLNYAGATGPRTDSNRRLSLYKSDALAGLSYKGEPKGMRELNPLLQIGSLTCHRQHLYPLDVVSQDSNLGLPASCRRATATPTQRLVGKQGLEPRHPGPKPGALTLTQHPDAR